jgi:hypothetical protein
MAAPRTLLCAFREPAHPTLLKVEASDLVMAADTNDRFRPAMSCSVNAAVGAEPKSEPDRNIQVGTSKKVLLSTIP